ARRSASHIPPVGECAVRHAPTSADDSLVIEVVGETQTRADRVWVRLGESAVASSAAVTFIDNSARQTTRRWVRSVDADFASAPVQLVPLSGVIPAQAVVERKLARDSPGVLDI